MNANCQSCGAPDDGEAVLCKYCRRAVSAEAQAHAVPCPQCRTPARWGKQKCPACQAWIVVACVFCGALSPHNQQACLACREPFAGAAERKMQRQQQHSHAQSMQTLGTVGNIAASFLGAAAGVAVTHSWESHSTFSYGDSSYDEGSVDTFVDNTSEDTDWGGGDDGSGGWDE